MKENTDQPLISVIVITYNSSKFVLDTLESIRAQTYRNIELIVTDDCSTDETVTICSKWIQENKQRFVSTQVISSETNKGIPANINRGINISSGHWIKCIAGDDLLIKECLTELIQYISAQEEDIKVLSADIIRFSGTSVENGEIRKNPYTRFCSVESTPKEQYEMLLRTPMVFAATVIIRRDLLLSVNGFDERFNLMEDWPLWLKITHAGFKMWYLNKPLVYYRLHENNLSITTEQNYLYHPVTKISISFKEKVLAPRLPFIERLGLKYEILAMKTCFFLGNNKKNPFTRVVYFIFNISNPFFTYLRIKSFFGIILKFIKH